MLRRPIVYSLDHLSVLTVVCIWLFCKIGVPFIVVLDRRGLHIHPDAALFELATNYRVAYFVRKSTSSSRTRPAFVEPLAER